jgi:hypothetical protein
LIVHDRAVKVHFSRILRFEIARLQIHDDEAAEVKVIKEEVEMELPVADFKPVLASDKREAAPEF